MPITALEAQHDFQYGKQCGCWS